MAAARAPQRRSERPEVYIAFLRGVNVGGKNPIAMKDLVSIFSAAGCEGTQTYIQSGNILFTAAPAVVPQLPAEIAAQLEKKHGCRSAVLLRTAHELEQVLRHNPFLKTGVPEEMLHVMFLAKLPSASDTESLDARRSPPDEFLVRGREIYLRLPNGAARSKLTNAYFDTRLKTTSSSRNWRTVTRLCELASEMVS